MVNEKWLGLLCTCVCRWGFLRTWLDDGCLYGAIGAGRVVGAATAVWHGVTNRRSIEKWLGVVHMAWGGGVMCTCIEALFWGVIAHGLAVATEEAYPEAYRGP